MKIGFDFGMTNSTISYFDDEGRLVNFKINASENDYIPTIISYDAKKSGSVLIGAAAQDNIADERYETYDKFKLKLGTGATNPLPGKTKSPLNVSRDFIGNFLCLFQERQKKGVEAIVMTVPATWIKETNNHLTRENLEEIYKELGFINELQLESEPVAAAVFFCHAYKNRYGAEYKGFITVIDYGGGTLDVTLCEATGDKPIKVLEYYGCGEDNQTNGQAGVAFDEAVTEKLIKDNELEIERNSIEFIELRNMFEQRKITQRDKVTEQLKDYFDDPSILEGEYLFSLRYGGKTINVRCEDLVECFNKVNAPALLESLNGAKQYFDAHNVDASSQTDFKVLLVGGFSNFYAVEAEVRKFFSSHSEYDDKRFEQPFEDINRSFAISRGAALIAQKFYAVEHTCPYSIGYISYEIKGDSFIPKNVPVILKGTKIADLTSAVFSKSTLRIGHKSGRFRMYFDDGRLDGVGRHQIKLEERLSDLFPNVDAANEYKIGFSLNHNTVPTMHIVDKNGNEIKTSLFKLYENISVPEQ